MSEIIKGGIQFATIIIILKILTAQEYGEIGIVLSIASFFGIAQHMGINSGTIREIARCDSRLEVSFTFVVSLGFRLLLLIPVAISLYLLSPLISIGIYNNESMIEYLRFMAFIMIVKGLSGNYYALLLALMEYRIYYWVNIIFAIFASGLLVLMTYSNSTSGYFNATLLSQTILLLTLVIIGSYKLKIKLIIPNKSEFKKIFINIYSISMQVYVIKIANEVRSRGMVAILGAYFTPVIAGQFYFALRIAESFAKVVKSITTVSMPYFSKLYKNTIEDYSLAFKRNFNRTTLIIAILTMLLICYTSEIMRIMVGDKYEHGYQLLPVMIGASYFRLIGAYIGTNYFVSSGNLGVSVKINLLSVFVMLVLTLLSIHSGAMAVALSTLVSYVLYYALHHYYVYKKFMTSLYSKNTLKVVLFTLIPIIISTMANNVIENILLLVITISSLALIMYFDFRVLKE